MLLRMGNLFLPSCGKQGRKNSLFNLNWNWNRHKSNVIYRAECHCGVTHIGEREMKLPSTKGRRREQVSQLRTSPSPRENAGVWIKSGPNLKQYYPTIDWRSVYKTLNWIDLQPVCSNQENTIVTLRYASSLKRTTGL